MKSGSDEQSSALLAVHLLKLYSISCQVQGFSVVFFYYYFIPLKTQSCNKHPQILTFAL